MNCSQAPSFEEVNNQEYFFQLHTFSSIPREPLNPQLKAPDHIHAEIFGGLFSAAVEYEMALRHQTRSCRVSDHHWAIQSQSGHFWLKANSERLLSNARECHWRGHFSNWCFTIHPENSIQYEKNLESTTFNGFGRSNSSTAWSAHAEQQKKPELGLLCFSNALRKRADKRSRIPSARVGRASQSVTRSAHSSDEM